MSNKLTLSDIYWGYSNNSVRGSNDPFNSPLQGVILLPNGWAINYGQSTFSDSTPLSDTLFTIGIMRPLTKAEAAPQTLINARLGTLINSTPPKALLEIIPIEDLDKQLTIYELRDIINTLANIESPEARKGPNAIPMKHILQENVLDRNEYIDITQNWTTPINPQTGEETSIENFEIMPSPSFDN